LRPQLFDSAQFQGNLREGAGGIRIQPTQPALARLELPTDRALPSFGLFLQSA
jgi:hypothetical protein